MFKRSSLSDSDRQIGIRLQYLRRRNGLTQTELGAKVGLTRSQLTDIESCRTSLKLQPGWEICRVLDIHPGWLLLEASSFLKPFPEDSPALERVEKIIKGSPKSPFWSLGNFIWMLGPDGERMFQDSQSSTSAEKIRLTNINKTETLQPMTMKTLLARVRKATAERGERSKLARHLGVSLANVSQWLAEKNPREPSGETTLKLLHWVEQQEGK